MKLENMEWEEVRPLGNYHVELRELLIQDFCFVKNWSNDEAFCLANGWENGRSEGELYSWWCNCVNNQSPDFLRLGIQYESRLIGYADLTHIKNNRAELGIAIGESRFWGHGIGAETLMQLMNYANLKFGTQIFNAETHDLNLRSRKMLEKLGFTEFSRIGSEEYIGKKSELIQYRFHRGR